MCIRDRIGLDCNHFLDEIVLPVIFFRLLECLLNWFQLDDQVVVGHLQHRILLPQHRYLLLELLPCQCLSLDHLQLFALIFIPPILLQTDQLNLQLAHPIFSPFVAIDQIVMVLIVVLKGSSVLHLLLFHQLAQFSLLVSLPFNLVLFRMVVTFVHLACFVLIQNYLVFQLRYRAFQFLVLEFETLHGNHHCVLLLQ